MIFLLAGCAEPPEAKGGGLSFERYAGAPGFHYEFREVDVDDGATLTLDSSEESWSLSRGDAEPIEVATTRNDGFFIEDAKVLPAVVEDVDARKVYYGTFPTVTTVMIADGAWAGESAWAVDVGPVVLTLRETTWELVYYE